MFRDGLPADRNNINYKFIIIKNTEQRPCLTNWNPFECRSTRESIIFMLKSCKLRLAFENCLLYNNYLYNI